MFFLQKYLLFSKKSHTFATVKSNKQNILNNEQETFHYCTLEHDDTRSVFREHQQ